jgi:protein-S-isoprenylcysteine O-methyltransferase Ste14
MRLSRHSRPDPSQSRWQEFAEFCGRHWARILATLALALAVDYLGGRLLTHDLANVHSPRALAGLALLFAGCTALAWAAGSRAPAQRFPVSPLSLVADPRYIGALLAMLGLSLTIDDPKNICLLLGPVILLDLIRLRRSELDETTPIAVELAPTYATSWLASAAANLRSRRGHIVSSLAPLLMIPVVTFVVILYAWPFNSLAFHETWEIWCLLLSFVGLAIRMLAAGQASGPPSRNANFYRSQTFKTNGIYSVVRYPKYLGDYFIGLGVVLIPFVWWMPVAYSLLFYAHYRRKMDVDDAQLRHEFPERYAQWEAVTPALMPRLWRRRQDTSQVFRWAAAPRFSFRTALKREYAGIFLVIFLHASVEWLEHLILERRVMLELFWIIVALAGLTACLLVRYLARHTRVLNAPAS